MRVYVITSKLEVIIYNKKDSHLAVFFYFKAFAILYSNTKSGMLIGIMNIYSFQRTVSIIRVISFFKYSEAG
jgi:hypothetical protein